MHPPGQLILAGIFAHSIAYRPLTIYWHVAHYAMDAFYMFHQYVFQLKVGSRINRLVGREIDIINFGLLVFFATQAVNEYFGLNN